MIGKAAWLAKGRNPRFVVTSLPAETYDAPSVHEKIYCARGEMENRIKEQQLDLFVDRTSTVTMRANPPDGGGGCGSRRWPTRWWWPCGGWG